MNNMSRQELQTAAAESERLRLLMYAEQRNLKEALKQKKEMNAHLRQSLLEQRQESDTRALVHKKQQQELREKISALEQAKQKELKELDRVRSKGINSENSISTVREIRVCVLCVFSVYFFEQFYSVAMKRELDVSLAHPEFRLNLRNFLFPFLPTVFPSAHVPVGGGAAPAENV